MIINCINLYNWLGLFLAFLIWQTRENWLNTKKVKTDYFLKYLKFLKTDAEMNFSAKHVRPHKTWFILKHLRFYFVRTKSSKSSVYT